MKTPLEVLHAYPAHDGTVAGLLASRASRDPQRPFLVFEDRTLRWGDVPAAVERVARGLAARGVAKGDRVGVMARNCDAFVLLWFALARLGAILVPVNADFGAQEARYVLGHAGVAGVACTAGTLAVVRAACDGLPDAPWLVSLDGDAAGVPGLDAPIDDAPAAAAPPPAAPDDTCLILYTSGTTGFPKGVMHSQRSFVLAGEAFVERMHLQPEDRVLCVLPLFHANALFYSLGGAAAAGACLVLAPRFSASGFWPLVARSGATEVNILAAVGSILAQRPRDEFVPGHRLAKIYGAPIADDVYRVFREEFGVPVLIEGYGMTEVPGACNMPFDGPHRPSSMGHAARHPDRSRPFAELRVVGDDGEDLPDGEVGELLVRTPIVMQGYYRDPEQTAAAFRGGWFATGDLVRRDAGGCYHFVARRKDIIRRRGENIAGAELDRVIGEHPAVAEAAAIGVPSELGEEEILVAVIPRDGASPDARDIAAWVARRLAANKVPRYVVFTDALPRTATHRVAKFRLKEDRELLARAIDLGAPRPGRR